MRCLKTIGRRNLAVALLCVAGGLWGCNGSNTPGRMEWVTSHNSAPHVGTVYCIRGWSGVFSAGIDEMAGQINAAGGTAVVYMPEQYPELAAAMVRRYKDDPRHEPIIFVGHSRGVDPSLIISRELDKAGVDVDMIVCLDSVDEVTVPKNVRACYNYWMPGDFGDHTNFLRGIPLVKAPDSTGKLFNIDLDTDGRALRGALTDHVSMDDDTKLQHAIIEHVMAACPERSTWEKGAPTTTR
jgi:hypothetical protein